MERSQYSVKNSGNLEFNIIEIIPRPVCDSIDTFQKGSNLKPGNQVGESSRADPLSARLENQVSYVIWKKSAS